MRKTLLQAAALVLLAAVPATLAAFFHPRRPAFSETVRDGEIAAETAARAPGRYLWVDARPAGEFAASHAPGALRLTEDEWDALLPAVLQAWPSEMPAIVYCGSRQCGDSAAVARRLREFHLGPVLVLKGGWEAWMRARKK